MSFNFKYGMLWIAIALTPSLSFADGRNHGRGVVGNTVGGITTDALGNRFDQFGNPIPDNRSGFQKTFDAYQTIYQQSFANVNSGGGRGAEAGQSASDNIKQTAQQIQEKGQQAQKQISEQTSKLSEESNKNLSEFVNQSDPAEETAKFFQSFATQSQPASTASSGSSAAQIIQLINDQTNAQIQALQLSVPQQPAAAAPPVQTVDFASKLGSRGPSVRDRNPLETAMAATRSGSNPIPQITPAPTIVGQSSNGAYGIKAKQSVPANVRSNTYNYPSDFFQ